MPYAVSGTEITFAAPRLVIRASTLYFGSTHFPQYAAKPNSPNQLSSTCHRSRLPNCYPHHDATQEDGMWAMSDTT
eukprot:3764278-Rhodomonas_salina.3